MKRKLYIITLIFAFNICTAVQAVDRIAVVNISSIFQQLPESAIVAKQLEDKFKGRINELQSIERDLKAKIQRLQNSGSTMKASERSLLEKSVITQREIFATKAQAFEQDNHRHQTEERNKILNRIQNAVKIVATKENYDIVIDANAVAYVNYDKDITAEVLKQVR